MKITNDRRKSPRVRLPGHAVIYDGNHQIPCEGVDLSVTGVGLRAPQKIKKGRKVQIVVPLGDQPMTIPAVVRRCRQDGRSFRVGARFEPLDPAFAQTLAAFVEGAGQRDVRMYQAQIFLARTGASELDSVFARAAQAREAELNQPTPAGPGRPVDEAVPTSETLAIDPTALERPITGQNAIVVDEDAPTGPNKVVDPKVRPKTAAWKPTRPQGHESVDSPQLRTAVTSALFDIEAELAEAGGDVARAGTSPNEETVMTGPPPSRVPASYSAIAPDLELPTRAPTATSALKAPGFAADLSSLDYGGFAESRGAPGVGEGTMVVDQRVLAERSRGVSPPPPPAMQQVEHAAAPPPRAPTAGADETRVEPDGRGFAPSLANLDFEDEGPTQLFDGDEDYEYVLENSHGAPARPSPAPPPARPPSRPPPPPHDEGAEIHHPPSPFGASAAPPTIPGRSHQTIPSGPMGTQIAIEAPRRFEPPQVAGQQNRTQIAMDPPFPPSPPPRTDRTQIAIPAPGSLPYGPVSGESTQVAIPAAGLPQAPLGSPAPKPPLRGAGQQPPSPFARVEVGRPSPAPLQAPRVAAPPAGSGARRPVPPSQQATMAPPEDDLQTQMHDAAEDDDKFAEQYERALTDLELESR